MNYWPAGTRPTIDDTCPEGNPRDCEYISVRAIAAINKLGVRTWRGLSELSETDVLRIKGAGRRTLRELRESLHEMGLDFRPPLPDVAPQLIRLCELVLTTEPPPCTICRQPTIFGVRFNQKPRVPRVVRWFCSVHLVACLAELCSGKDA